MVQASFLRQSAWLADRTARELGPERAFFLATMFALSCGSGVGRKIRLGLDLFTRLLRNVALKKELQKAEARLDHHCESLIATHFVKRAQIPRQSLRHVEHRHWPDRLLSAWAALTRWKTFVWFVAFSLLLPQSCHQGWNAARCGPLTFLNKSSNGQGSGSNGL